MRLLGTAREIGYVGLFLLTRFSGQLHSDVL